MTTGQDMALAINGHAMWANTNILDAAVGLSQDQLDLNVPGGYSTIRGTLVHMMAAQRSWLRRWQELDPVPPLETATFRTIEEIRATWTNINTETSSYLASLSESDLEQIIHLKFWSGEEDYAPRWQAILHQAMHQHQHRGELAAILTTLGYSPGEIDVLDYFDTLRE